MSVLLSAVRRDVRMTKLYVGSVGIGGRSFRADLEEPGSDGFTSLAQKVRAQVRRLPQSIMGNVSCLTVLCLPASADLRPELGAGQVLQRLHGAGLQVSPRHVVFLKVLSMFLHVDRVPPCLQ